MDELEKIYNKLSKKQLIRLLIENNKSYQPSCCENNEEVPYHEICSCNPRNGGSGICGCTMANTMVKKNNNNYFINTYESSNYRK